MTETQLSRAVQDALETMGALVVRVQSGMVRGPHGVVQLAPAGTPDLWVGWRNASGWLEVKSESGRNRVDPAQVRWHAAAERQGVRVEVVRSVEQAVRAVRSWAEKEVA